MIKIRPDRRQLKDNPDAASTSRWPPRTAARDSGPSLLTRFIEAAPNTEVANSTDVPFTPPDTMGDIGPSQYVVALNGLIRTISRDTGVKDDVLNVPLDVFYGRTDTGDPRVRYDRRTGRWFVLAFTIAAPNSYVLAVSSGGVITASTSWFIHEWINTRTAGGVPGAAGCLGDYPTLGIDEDALYIGVNQFCGGDLNTVTFDSTSAYVVRKSALPGSLVVFQFDGLMTATDATGPFTPQGVDNMDAGTDTGYFIGVDGAMFSLIQMRRVTNPGGTPSLSANIPITVSATQFPVHVPQPGVTQRLDGLDDRLLQAVIRQGRLWTSHGIGVNASGVASASATRTATRWYELQDLGTTALAPAPVVRQSGTVFDATSQALSYWMSAINVNGQGHAAMGLTRAGAGTGGHANAAFTGRLATDTLGTMASPLLYTANTSFTLNTGIQPSSNVKRWGDYSYTSVDPNDDMTMWTLQEYVAADNRWAIRLVKLRPPPPATITTVSPATVTSGQADVTVTVTGTASSGSGFFDPGPGFASRLSAAFSGSNVTVTGVTVNSPTQVTLTLSTAGAAPGSRTLTVTNPDGQSASLAAALTVVAPPTFTVTPTSWQVPSAGGTQAVTVTASAGDAAWTASSSQPWLALSTTGGTGSGSVTLTVAATPSMASRTATATIAGQTVTVTQAGGTPTFTLSATDWNVPAQGGTQAVTVTSTLGDAAWTATSSQPWLALSTAGGTGSGSVTLTVAATPSMASRTATATIAGQTVTVDQSGGAPTFTLSTTDWSVPAQGGTQAVTVTSTLNDATWTATSSQPWLTLSTAGGTGSGTVTLTTAPTTTVAPRTAMATIAGQAVTVTQAGGTPTFTLSATDWNVPAQGGTQAVTVTSPLNDATWTATSSQPWLALSTAGGTGNGSVTLTAAPTTTVAPRTATATIAGQVVTVTQAGGSSSFTVAPAVLSAPSGGGSQTFTVTSSLGDAPWTASSGQAWLTLTTTSGTGSGTVTLTAAPTTTVAPRTATATIAGQVVTITQAGAVPTFNLDADRWEAPGRGGQRTVTLSSSVTDGPWVATSAVPWLTVSPAAGIGPTALTVTAQGLPGIDSRIGSVLIGGEALSVAQTPIEDQPLDLTVASVRGSTVELRWLWAGTAPDGYLLTGGLSPGETLAILPTGSAAPTFTFSAPPGKFYVRMVGLRDGIELPPSADVLISVQVPEPPSAPTSLQGVATGSRLDLTWITTSNGGTATGTLLEVSGTLSGVVPLPLTDRVSFEGVPDGTYTIRVRATGEAGTSDASAPITLSFPGRCELPEAAEAFHVYTTGPIVTLRWNPPASGAAATGYLLNVSGPVTVSLPVSGREFISPAPAGVYTFSVTSVNTCGQGATTATRVITVPQ